MIGGNYASTNLGKLHVDGVIGIDDEGSGTSTLNIMTAANTRLKIQATGSIAQILTQNDVPFAIKTDAGTGGGTERFRIATDGDIGIGVAPSARLHVSGGDGLLVERSAGSSIAGFKHSGATAMNIYFENTGSSQHPYIGSDNQDLTSVQIILKDFASNLMGTLVSVKMIHRQSCKLQDPYVEEHLINLS